MSDSIHYPPSYDIIYRTGYVIQFMGLMLFFAAYLKASPWQLGGLILFQGGVLLSGFFLLVWNQAIKKFILTAIISGLIVESLAYYTWDSAYNIAFLAGVGLVLVGAAGLVGKEAYCFRFQAGWGLLGLYPVLVLANLLFPQARTFLILLYLTAILLFISFLYRKLSQPLIHHCSHE